MSPRNPFAFLDSESRERTLLLLLLAIIRKSGGELTIDLTDLTSIEDGASFHKFPDDTGTRLMLRYARRGAEAYYLPATEDRPSQPTPRPTRTQATVSSLPPTTSPSEPSPTPPTPRHSIHDDMDLALREDEMATRARSAQQERLRQARAQAGVMPWRTERPQ